MWKRKREKAENLVARVAEFRILVEALPPVPKKGQVRKITPGLKQLRKQVYDATTASELRGIDLLREVDNLMRTLAEADLRRVLPIPDGSSLNVWLQKYWKISGYTSNAMARAVMTLEFEPELLFKLSDKKLRRILLSLKQIGEAGADQIINNRRMYWKRN